MGAQTKKKTRSFSLDDEEWGRVEKKLLDHGFADRNEYLMALVECDEALGFWVVLANKQKVLRPDPASIGIEKITTLGAGATWGDHAHDTAAVAETHQEPPAASPSNIQLKSAAAKLLTETKAALAAKTTAAKTAPPEKGARPKPQNPPRPQPK